MVESVKSGRKACPIAGEGVRSYRAVCPGKCRNFSECSTGEVDAAKDRAISGAYQ
jgi:hypothetical protein